MTPVPSPGEDELFAPTLQDEAARPAGAPRPWNVGSQFWVAFLGGPLAVGAIAWLNAPRLGLTPTRRRWMLVASLAAFALALGIVGWIAAGTAREAGLPAYTRRIPQVTAVALYLLLALLQKPGARRYEAFGGEYASLWRAGFLAILGGGAVQVALGVAVVLLARGL